MLLDPNSHDAQWGGDKRINETIYLLSMWIIKLLLAQELKRQQNKFFFFRRKIEDFINENQLY